MAIGRQTAPAGRAGLFPRPTWTTGWLSWLTTVDHKRLGLMYIISSFIFMGLASLEAFIIRLQLARPEQQLVSPDVFNQLFTMHGMTMVFFAIMPLGIGLANYFVPLMIGARDLAFPRLNAFGYWVFSLAGIFLYTSWFLGGAPDAGWFGYSPLTSLTYNPGNGIDFYSISLLTSGFGTLVTAINLIVTVVNMRAPGMTMMRIPLFAWMVVVMSFLIIFAFPPLTIALFQLTLDRVFGTLHYVPEAGALPILWQHFFWIFGHPEVYIIIMPAFGIISEIIPTFSRKPLFGYPIMVLSGIFIGFMGFAVWSHHMFTTGLGPVANTAFALTSFVIGIPTGIKIFNWLGTMWGGSVRFTVAMLYAVAFLVTFTLGGITGIMVAIPPFDAQAQDTYFVVAHFHYVMGGGALLAYLGALYYWFPKMSGRMLDERLGKVSFWFTVIGFHTIFFPQHILGLMGMPRRIQTYEANIGLDFYNFLSTAGTFIMAIGVIMLAFDVFRQLRKPKWAPNDPWDGRTLEWATTSPPPHYDFAVLPQVTDRDPVWAWKHPELLETRDAISRAVDEDTQPEPAREVMIHLPGQSWWPFLMSAAIFVGSYALVYRNVWLMIASAFFVILTGFGWAFEGVGGHYEKVKAEKIDIKAGGQA